MPSSAWNNNKRNCDDDNSVVVSDEAEPEADDDHDGPHDGPSLSVPRSWTKDYIKDLKTAYDSETKTAEDNVPILDYFKYLLKPVYEDDENEGEDQDHHNGQEDDEEDSSKLIPIKHRIVNEEFANIVGHVSSKLMSEARYQIVEQSQEMFVPSWSRGKINKEDLGYIPPLALLLCLPEHRFHHASETDLERILNAVPNYLDVIKDMLRFWGREQKYTRLMAKEKKKGITRMFKQNKEIECYKALIFVFRMYAAEKFLNPQRNLSVPPQQLSSSSSSSSAAAAAGDAIQIGLDRVDHYLQFMNHHIAVTPKEMKEWREELKDLTQRRKRRKLEREIEEQSDSESESEPEPESELVMMDSPSSRTRSQRTRGGTRKSSSAATRTRTETAAGHRRTTRASSSTTTRAGLSATRPSAVARAAAATATRTERATRERTVASSTPVSASPRRVRITRFNRASAGGTKRKSRLYDSDSEGEDDDGGDDEEVLQDELQEDDLFMFK